MIRGLHWCLIVLGLGLLSAAAEVNPPKSGFSGITIVRPSGAEFPVIDYVAPGSSAANAGIRKGEDVTAIYGISTAKMTTLEARHAMEGDVGATLTLTLHRTGAKPRDVSVQLLPLLDAYQQAITAGDPKAEVAVGYNYEHGPASVLDPVKAAEWYRKAAEKGDAPGERSLGALYFYGKGLKQSDADAFAWFYSAAVQDDARAEYYLGQMYQNGRAVKASNSDSFYWYEKAARHDLPYAQWNLGYAYEKGLGVKADPEEALKWFRKAAVGLPDDSKLIKHIAVLNMKAFVDNPDSVSLDSAAIMAAFGKYLLPFFYAIMAAYALGGIVLFFFSFRAAENPSGILVALGWLIFQLAGQVVALAVLFVQGSALTAVTLFVTTCFFSAGPLIASSLGPNRHWIWKASPLSWKTLFLYGVGSYVANFILLVGYDKIYTLVTHATMPGQPTALLISKAKHGSAILAYACIALALPLAEEILFRGYLFEALKKRLPDIAVVILTAFAFSLVHFQGLYFVSLFGFGLVQGWVRLKTGSLRLPVLLHVLNNAFFLAASS